MFERNIAGKVPAHSLESESGLLAMILDAKRNQIESASTRAVALLQPEDFYSVSHQTIWRAVCDLERQGVLVTLETVTMWLREEDLLQRAGGLHTLQEYAFDAGFGDARLEQHCKAIKDRARIRELCATCQRISAECYGPIEDHQAFIELAESKLSELARDPAVASIDTLGQTLHDVFSAIASGKSTRGLSTGFGQLDGLIFGLRPQEQIIVAARSGVGKSAYMMDLALNVASLPPDAETGMLHGVFIASLEMSKDQLVGRTIASRASVPAEYLLDPCKISDSQWSNLTTAAKWLGALPIWIDDTPSMTPLDIRNKAKGLQFDLAKKGKIKLSMVMVDYLQLCDSKPLMRGWSSDEQQVAFTSKHLKETAKALNLPLVALAQMNRSVEQGKMRYPVMSDLRSSGQIEMDADTIIFIHRDEHYLRDQCPPEKKGVAELVVAKARSAKTGIARTRFIPEIISFRDDDGEVIG